MSVVIIFLLFALLRDEVFGITCHCPGNLAHNGLITDTTGFSEGIQAAFSHIMDLKMCDNGTCILESTNCVGAEECKDPEFSRPMCYWSKVRKGEPKGTCMFYGFYKRMLEAEGIAHIGHCRMNTNVEQYICFKKNCNSGNYSDICYGKKTTLGDDTWSHVMIGNATSGNMPYLIKGSPNPIRLTEATPIMQPPPKHQMVPAQQPVAKASVLSTGEKPADKKMKTSGTDEMKAKPAKTAAKAAEGTGNGGRKNTIAHIKAVILALVFIQQNI